MNEVLSRIFSIVCILMLIMSTLLCIIDRHVSAESAIGIQFTSRVDIQWDLKETQEPIVPRDDIKTLNLTVAYTVDTGDYIAEGLYNIWKDATNKKGDQVYHSVVKIELNITDKSPWCSTALKSNFVYVNFSKNQTTTATLYLTIDEDAPAFGLGYIDIKAKVSKITGTPIKNFTKTFNLSFTPSYKPYIDINLPEKNSIEINPMEQAVFPIDIENLGNSRTKVFLEVVNLPEGWSGVVANELTLEEKRGARDTANLSIQPPKTFGYHDEYQIIQVAITPARAENIADQGDTLYATVMVKSKGFATPGFQSDCFIVLLMIVCMIGYVKGYKKRI